ncbi:MAG TPA: hypothetical protein PKM43_05150 [Verrucomicrobiota bacterium]|nr:hypothetical protein [Verrucomicrobiota bacterium]HRZ34955.1 hypothetical protein [Candidatus Paceibacterota bacterium]
MKPTFLTRAGLSVGTLLALALSAQAEPLLPNQIELRNTIHFAEAAGVTPNSMYNPRYFDGNVYVAQINASAFGRYRSGAQAPSMYVDNTPFTWAEHRMVAPFRGANQSVYLMGAGGAGESVYLTRYDFNGANPNYFEFPGGGQVVESFDWVDESTIIYCTYTPSSNRRRLSLAQVTAEPFSVEIDTRWNAEGFVETTATTRIRNVRVGDQYSGYAYYGDAGQNSNPRFFAINLATGVETALGDAGALTGGGSFGLWTVVERGGYLYVQTTDNGILVYAMTSATTLGPLYTTHTKEQLEQWTGYAGQFWGFDVGPDGRKLVLAADKGVAYEVGEILPLKVRNTIHLATDLGITPNTMYNPRYFDDQVYVVQISNPAIGRYPAGSNTPSLAVDNTNPQWEHRMLAPFRGANKSVYILGSSGAVGNTMHFSRYDADGSNRQDAPVPGGETAAASFDWVDENTIIYTTYTPSAARRRLSLARVVAEPFSVTPDTRWNANGYVETTATTRIRNVRVGDQYSGYAYYSDAGQNSDPRFFAINLATGAETALGDAGTLTGTGSFGLWTVVERGGKLYLQTTDNGIQVYTMTSATTLGPLVATYSASLLEEVTGQTGQYWGFDVAPDGTLLLGRTGQVLELEVRQTEPPLLSIARAQDNVILSWPATATDAVLQATPSLAPLNFVDLDPQPPVSVVEGQNTVTIPSGAAAMFYRLRQ